MPREWVLQPPFYLYTALALTISTFNLTVEVSISAVLLATSLLL